MFDGWLSGQMMSPLLTQTPVERLVESDVACGHNAANCWVVDQVPVGVGRVTDQTPAKAVSSILRRCENELCTYDGQPKIRK